MFQILQTNQFAHAISFKSIVVLGVILFATTACQKKPSNIIIISVDTLNQSAFKVYNSRAPVLKTLDFLADQSVVFKRAYSSASWTLPAHGSLFTGLYPDRHGAVDPRLKLSDTISTLADQLKRSGFYTAAFTDGGYISRDYGFGRGFDRYDGWVSPSVPWKGPDLPRKGERNKLAGQNLFDRGIAFLNDSKTGDNSFFLFLHTYMVHDYFALHPWAINQLPEYSDRGVNDYLSCITGKETCPPADWERLKSLYQAELYRMDEGLARLLATLDRQDLRNSTVIIFLSDHGEGFDPNRNRIHHGGRLHEDQIKIPLMISGPGINHHISETAVSIVDIMPTVLDLCGIPIQVGLDGVSFTDVLRGEKRTQSRVFFAMEYFHWWDSGRRLDVSSPQSKPISIAAMRKEDWYIKDMKGEEIYNMNEDPHQTKNLSGNLPLKSELVGLTETRSVYGPSAPVVAPSKETIDQLRSLGYVE